LSGSILPFGDRFTGDGSGHVVMGGAVVPEPQHIQANGWRRS